LKASNEATFGKRPSFLVRAVVVLLEDIPTCQWNREVLNNIVNSLFIYCTKMLRIQILEA
jgi:hypothetical protein